MDLPYRQFYIILLNYKRPKNINLILDVFKQQKDFRPYVILINNNSECKTFENDKRVDWYLCNNKNKGCLMRWVIAQMCNCKYIIFMDDDLLPNSNLFLKKIDEVASNYDKLQIKPLLYGITGVMFPENYDAKTINYFSSCRHILNTTKRINTDIKVDIIKGRFMVINKSVLNKFPFYKMASLNSKLLHSKSEYNNINTNLLREDDILGNILLRSENIENRDKPMLVYEWQKLFDDIEVFDGTGNSHSKTHGTNRINVLRFLLQNLS